MSFKLPKTNKKGYTFRIPEPLAVKFYKYCENSNIKPAEYITNFLKQEMKNKTVERQEYDKYCVLALDKQGDLAITNLLNDFNISEYKTELLEENKESKLIVTKPNNYLDYWIQGTYRSLEHENMHEGLGIIKEKVGALANSTIFIKYLISESGTVQAFKISEKEAIQEAANADNKELINMITKEDNLSYIKDLKDYEDLIYVNKISASNEQEAETGTEAKLKKLEQENKAMQEDIKELKAMLEIFSEKVTILNSNTDNTNMNNEY